MVMKKAENHAGKKRKITFPVGHSLINSRDFSRQSLNSARYNPSTKRNANAKPAAARGLTMAENNTTNAATMDIPAST
jgi:hypothetical protein